MSNTIDRYEAVDVVGAPAYMQQATDGAYINRTDLLTKLNTMKANACDPAETDTLNTILKLLEG